MKYYPAYKEQKHENITSIQRTKAWKITQHTKNKSMKRYPAYKEQRQETLPSMQSTKAWKIIQ